MSSVRLRQAPPNLASLVLAEPDSCICRLRRRAGSTITRLDRKAVHAFPSSRTRLLRKPLHRSERITALSAASKWGCSESDLRIAGNDALSKSSTLTKLFLVAQRPPALCRRAARQGVAGIDTCFDGRSFVGPAEGPRSRSSDARSFFFRIKSSAIRAFGGCLGSKRR